MDEKERRGDRSRASPPEGSDIASRSPREPLQSAALQQSRGGGSTSTALAPPAESFRSLSASGSSFATNAVPAAASSAHSDALASAVVREQREQRKRLLAQSLGAVADHLDLPLSALMSTIERSSRSNHSDDDDDGLEREGERMVRSGSFRKRGLRSFIGDDDTDVSGEESRYPSGKLSQSDAATDLHADDRRSEGGWGGRGRAFSNSGRMLSPQARPALHGDAGFDEARGSSSYQGPGFVGGGSASQPARLRSDLSASRGSRRGGSGRTSPLFGAGVGDLHAPLLPSSIPGSGVGDGRRKRADDIDSIARDVAADYRVAVAESASTSGHGAGAGSGAGSRSSSSTLSPRSPGSPPSSALGGPTSAPPSHFSGLGSQRQQNRGAPLFSPNTSPLATPSTSAPARTVPSVAAGAGVSGGLAGTFGASASLVSGAAPDGNSSCGGASLSTLAPPPSSGGGATKEGSLVDTPALVAFPRSSSLGTLVGGGGGSVVGGGGGGRANTSGNTSPDVNMAHVLPATPSSTGTTVVVSSAAHNPLAHAITHSSAAGAGGIAVHHAIGPASVGVGSSASGGAGGGPPSTITSRFAELSAGVVRRFSGLSSSAASEGRLATSRSKRGSGNKRKRREGLRVGFAPELTRVSFFEVDDEVYVSIEYRRPVIGWIVLLVSMLLATLGETINSHHYLVGGSSVYVVSWWSAFGSVVVAGAAALLSVTFAFADGGDQGRARPVYPRTTSAVLSAVAAGVLFACMRLSDQVATHIGHLTSGTPLASTHPILLTLVGKIFKHVLFWEELLGSVLVFLGACVARYADTLGAPNLLATSVVAFAQGVFAATFVFMAAVVRARLSVVWLFAIVCCSHAAMQFLAAAVADEGITFGPTNNGWTPNSMSGFCAYGCGLWLAASVASALSVLGYLVSLQYLPPIAVSVMMTVTPILHTVLVQVLFVAPNGVWQIAKNDQRRSPSYTDALDRTPFYSQFSPIEFGIGAGACILAVCGMLYVGSIKRAKVEMLLRFMSRRRVPRNPYVRRYGGIGGSYCLGGGGTAASNNNADSNGYDGYSDENGCPDPRDEHNHNHNQNHNNHAGVVVSPISSASSDGGPSGGTGGGAMHRSVPMSEDSATSLRTVLGADDEDQTDVVPRPVSATGAVAEYSGRGLYLAEPRSEKALRDTVPSQPGVGVGGANTRGSAASGATTTGLLLTTASIMARVAATAEAQSNAGGGSVGGGGGVAAVGVATVGSDRTLTCSRSSIGGSVPSPPRSPPPQAVAAPVFSNEAATRSLYSKTPPQGTVSLSSHSLHSTSTSTASVTSLSHSTSSGSVSAATATRSASAGTPPHARHTPPMPAPLVAGGHQKLDKYYDEA